MLTVENTSVLGRTFFVRPMGAKRFVVGSLVDPLSMDGSVDSPSGLPRSETSKSIRCSPTTRQVNR